MAKRASILPENYNPVGERLRRVTEPPPPQLNPSPEPKMIELSRPFLEPDATVERLPVALREREAIPEIPVDRELKTVSVRFRCTLNERRKWHEIARELSGDQNNLSHFIRATMLLVENSYEQLRRLAPDIQRFNKPASADTLGLVLYEQRLSQHLYDAIKGAGRPKV